MNCIIWMNCIVSRDTRPNFFTDRTTEMPLKSCTLMLSYESYMPSHSWKTWPIISFWYRRPHVVVPRVPISIGPAEKQGIKCPRVFFGQPPSDCIPRRGRVVFHTLLKWQLNDNERGLWGLALYWCIVILWNVIQELWIDYLIWLFSFWVELNQILWVNIHAYSIHNINTFFLNHI